MTSLQLGRSRTVYFEDPVSTFRNHQLVDRTHMLKLRDIRARNIDQRPIGMNNPIRDKRAHAEMVLLHSNTLQVPPGKDQRPKILVNRLQQRPGGGVMKTRSAGMLVAPVAVDPDVVSEISFAGAAESFDGEDLAFFHALRGRRLDEGDLFGAVDLVAQDVVAGDVADRFDGDGLAVELDFVALHDFLDGRADVVDSGVDASFLGGWGCLALRTSCKAGQIRLP